MKICQFTYNEKPGELRVGIVDGDKVVDVNKADPSLPTTLLDILKKGDIEKVKNLKPSSSSAVPLSSVTLKAPITGMDKVLCVGLNYKDHCEEQHLAIPEVPMIFSKFASCVVGPSDALRLRTELSDQVDWEVEMAVVISKTASNVKAADAYKHVLGCTVAQDISCRDWQKDKNKNNGQFLLGKAMDTFCPLGPWIVTPDETGDPENLNIKCSVNGVLKQNSNTNQLVHKIPAVIERLSS
ncbi:fumarylacetoacetate (FAA) hydrolase family domain-containing protein [Phthorimaea operculella]|nr:fumarylacetoacetate (FAA) hydrolase family domain-containing protein [Phthorimaea operculella]